MLSRIRAQKTYRRWSIAFIKCMPKSGPQWNTRTFFFHRIQWGGQFTALQGREGFKVFHAVVCSQLFCAVFLSWSLTLTLSISWIYYIPLFCVQQLVAWDKGCICKLSGISPRYFWAIISSGFSLNRPSTRQLLSQIVITYRSLAAWSPPERVLCIDYTSSGGQILHCCSSG